MFRFTGFLFILLGILVRLLFSNHRPANPPARLFLGFLNIALIPAGILLIIFSYRKRKFRSISKPDDPNFYLKETGEKIIVPLDDCEFKSHNYEMDLGEMQSQFEAFERPDHHAHTENILQSIAIFQHKKGGRTEIFQSPVFPIDVISLKAHILRNNLVLYVDRKDRSKYYFELKDPNLETV